MANNNNGKPVNPWDPAALKEGLATAPLVPMDYVGPTYKTTCSKFGGDVVDMFNNTLRMKSLIYCHIFPEIDRRNAIVSDVQAVMVFDASATVLDKDGQRVASEIWLNGKGGNGGNNRSILQYKQQRTPSGKFGTSEGFNKVFGAIAAEFDDDGKIIINEAPIEAVKKDRRYANFAYLKVDFFALMEVVMGIEDGSPYDYSVDFDQSRRQNQGHEDCVMVVSKFVGKKKSRVPRYNFDPQFMAETIENTYGNNGGRRYK